MDIETTILPHAEERVGHVAIDMGFMNHRQVEDTKLRMARSREAGETVDSFVQTAVRLNYLSERNVAALMAEEHRRRRLITGYEIIDIIGKGNVASVYLAKQLTMDREVALKVLLPRLASDPVFVQDYIDEARAVSQFHHPNIVQGFDAGEANGFYYFAHEYLPGGSMADRLATDYAHFTERRLLMYLRQTASALKHAWAVAVYHGDINPGNLLLDGNGDIKLANLGVPRVVDADKGIKGVGSVRSGPLYAAPEQLDNPEIVNAATDMYSLGATFYHISFGAPPFPGQSKDEIIKQRRANPVPSFSLNQQEKFSGKYLRLIHDLLEVDPNKRPANPEELADRLEKFHMAETADLSGLARQVRQIGLSDAVSQSTSKRLTTTASTPNQNAFDRPLALKTRTSLLGTNRGIEWLLAALATAAAVAIVGITWLA